MSDEELKKKYAVYVNAFEAGVLLGLIFGLDSDRKKALEDVLRQLCSLHRQFTERGRMEEDWGL